MFCVLIYHWCGCPEAITDWLVKDCIHSQLIPVQEAITVCGYDHYIQRDLQQAV